MGTVAFGGHFAYKMYTKRSRNDAVLQEIELG